MSTETDTIKDEAAAMQPNTPAMQPEAPVKKAIRRSPGPVKASDLKELKKTEELTAVALREPYATVLERYDISRAFIQTLATDSAQCRTHFADAVQAVDKKRGQTRAESSGKKSLLLLVRKVQAAASVKYARDATQAAVLKDYYIGVELTGSAARLAQYSAAILEKLGEDTLPGISSATVAALSDARAQWWSAHEGQQAAQDEATRKRAEGQAQLKIITDRRIRVQYAIESEYPYNGGTDATKAARAAFGLPATRPFRVTRG
ncbi:hypothetical protein [Armatimonas sp.]|uniref:hypothetical protein n=1 Tax=Armatimonas sp. TaxID=1872638 RepID=UPI00375346CE